MTTIIAGSRVVSNPKLLEQAIAESKFKITEVVSGCAMGVDTLGEQWAEQNKVPITRFPADWKTHGKSAGFIRNEEVARYAAQTGQGSLIAIWSARSAVPPQ